MATETRRDVFQAIADPTRRQIIHLIAREPMNLNAIAENFRISRPAVSQQIKILAECGLVEVTQKGRERYCEARLGGLRQVSAWLAPYKQFWEGRLGKIEDLLFEMQNTKSAGSKKRKK